MASHTGVINVCALLYMFCYSVNALGVSLSFDSHQAPKTLAPWFIDSGSCQTWPTLAWEEAIDFPAVDISFASNAVQNRPDAVLRIIESGQISVDSFHSLTAWIEAGGTALISGIPDETLGWCGQGRRVEPALLLELAGVKALAHNPRLLKARPVLNENSDLFFPLLDGDSFRLGLNGFGHALDLQLMDGEAQGGVLFDTDSSHFGSNNPSISHPSIVSRSIGDGQVLFTSFSLARVAHCYPDRNEAPTDCRASGNAQSLMRILVANALWVHEGIQWPIMRQSPGSKASAVGITGDVHADPFGIQVRGALELADVAREFDIPVTFYVVGEVATKFPVEYAKLQAFENVEIGSHSSRGQQYRLGHSRVPFRRRGGVHGAEAIKHDVQIAEKLLGLNQWQNDRLWWASIRTEAWGSNETESGAWTGMFQAGISLVLDHTVDVINSHPGITPPRAWFEVPARKRISIPAFTRNVHTATDDFRTYDYDLPMMFSISSPQPDPCCNEAVRFQHYIEYARGWHNTLRDIGKVLGTTQVWLWHPSTPLVHSAFEELKLLLKEMSEDDEVIFVSMDELATWNVRRHLGSLHLLLSADRSIEFMEWVPHTGFLEASSPLNSSVETREIGFWVFGDLYIDGWSTRLSNVRGRTVSTLTKIMEGQ